MMYLTAVSGNRLPIPFVEVFTPRPLRTVCHRSVENLYSWNSAFGPWIDALRTSSLLCRSCKCLIPSTLFGWTYHRVSSLLVHLVMARAYLFRNLDVSLGFFDELRENVTKPDTRERVVRIGFRKLFHLRDYLKTARRIVAGGTSVLWHRQGDTHSFSDQCYTPRGLASDQLLGRYFKGYEIE